MSQKAKCPKCGEIEQVEVTKTWGQICLFKLNPYCLYPTCSCPENMSKLEIYCNTCGQVSIIDGDTSSHTSEAKQLQE